MTDLEQKHAAYQREVCEWCFAGNDIDGESGKHHIEYEFRNPPGESYVACTALPILEWADQELKAKGEEIERLKVQALSEKLTTVAESPAPESANLSALSWKDLAALVRAIWDEMSRRNPIGINFYEGDILHAAAALEEIHAAESVNPTADGDLN